MPHRNGHTAIEMSPKPRRRHSRSPVHDTAHVHSRALDNQPHGSTLSPHADRSPHGSRGNVHHGSHDNVHSSSGNNLNVHNGGAHHSNNHSAPNSHSTSVNNLAHDDHLEPHSRHRRDVTLNVESPAGDKAPLLETDSTKPKPPLAGPEIDDLDDDATPAPASGQPGVDDGFYNSGDESVPDNKGETDDEGRSTSTGKVPTANGSKVDAENDECSSNSDDEADGLMHGHDGNYPLAGYPMMRSRSNFLDANDPNGFGIASRFDPATPFPMAPEFAPGAQPRVIPDVNVYQQKKNLAQGMMDLALLSANANQLRYVLEAGDYHPYFYPSMIFISASLILQIAVGVGLIVNSTYDVKDRDDICKADKINNFTVIGIFLITVVNVFIASFGVAQYPNSVTSVSPRAV